MRCERKPKTLPSLDVRFLCFDLRYTYFILTFATLHCKLSLALTCAKTSFVLS